jgi:hypothetical protein
MQMRGQRAVRTGVAAPWGLPVSRKRNFSGALRGVASSLKCAARSVPRTSRLPVGGSWSPDEVLALNTLIEDRGGAIKSVARTRSIATDSTIKFQPEFMPTTFESREIGPSAPYRSLDKGRDRTPWGSRGGADVRKHRRGLLVPNARAA